MLGFRVLGLGAGFKFKTGGKVHRGKRLTSEVSGEGLGFRLRG